MDAGKVDHRWRWLPRWPCELCALPAGRSGLCPGCHADLPWIRNACALCARPLPVPLPVPGDCPDCRARKPPWLRAIVPLAWRFPVDVLISRFKYGGALHYGAVLGRLLAACCDATRADGIVPVPLHPRRLRERGFNQARELARPVAEHCSLPILDDVCQRIVPTASQAGLAAQQRHRNVRGVFLASSRVRGRRLAILDDVLTTGSTAEAVARELLRAGAAEAEIWAVARGGTAQADANV